MKSTDLIFFRIIVFVISLSIFSSCETDELGDVISEDDPVEATEPIPPILVLPETDEVVFTEQPRFSWKSTQDTIKIIDYELKIDDENTISIGKDTIYKITTILETGSHNWKVRAKDNNNNWSAYSESRNFVVPEIITNCIKENIDTGLHNLPVWTSDSFEGTFCRKIIGDVDYLEITINENAGGFDTAVTINNSPTLVDDIAPGLMVSATIKVELENSGNWWVGPKFSVREDVSQGLEGNYENYVVENASRTPEEYDERLTRNDGIYLGETNQNGSIYKHYVKPHRTWDQYWAIRQDYRESGTVSLNPILEMWRNNNLPNEYLRTIRVNIETSGPVNGIATMTSINIPTSLAGN